MRYQTAAATAFHPGAGHYLACGALVLLLAALPLSRALAFILLPDSAATAAARIHIGAIELMFIAGVLADPAVARPRLRDLPPWALWIGGAWLLWSAIATALAAVPGAALLRQAEWLLHGGAAFCLWAFLSAYPQWRRYIPRAIVLGFLAYGVGITFFLRQVTAEDFPWLQAMLGFRNIRHFSAYAAIAVMAALYPLLATRDAAEKPTLPGIALVMTVPWAFLFWSGGRGAFLAVAAALAGMTLLRLVPHPGRAWAVILASAMTGVLVSIPFTPPHGSYGVIRLAGDLVESGSIEQYSSSRSTMWRQAAEMVLANPLTGLGPDNYAHTPRDPFDRFEHPHNAILQAALDWGLPGMVLAGAGICLALAAAYRHVRRNGEGEAVTGFGIAVMLLALSLVSSTLYYGLPSMVFLLALAMALPPRRGGR